jgi:hypothetical protein
VIESFLRFIESHQHQTQIVVGLRKIRGNPNGLGQLLFCVQEAIGIDEGQRLVDKSRGPINLP